MVRSAVTPALENIALWHERDISHSSVERILAPDITIALDFALSRLDNIIKNLLVYPKNMEKNLNLLGGLDKSQDLLLSLTKKIFSPLPSEINPFLSIIKASSAPLSRASCKAIVLLK